MRIEAEKVIVAVVEAMRKSALRPLPESYFGMSLSEKAAWLAHRMSRKPTKLDREAVPAPMTFQTKRDSSDHARYA